MRDLKMKELVQSLMNLNDDNACQTFGALVSCVAEIPQKIKDAGKILDAFYILCNDFNLIFLHSLQDFKKSLVVTLLSSSLSINVRIEILQTLLNTFIEYHYITGDDSLFDITTTKMIFEKICSSSHEDEEKAKQIELIVTFGSVTWNSELYVAMKYINLHLFQVLTINKSEYASLSKVHFEFYSGN